jgi:hypothetical protein
MGTSHAAKAPPTKKWSNVIASLRSPERNATTIINTTFSVAMGAMKIVYPVSTPIFCAASEGIRFALDVKDRGMDYAIKHEAIRVSERFIIPSISNGLWQLVSSKMDPEYTNSPFGKLAELAFKKTMNEIMTKGLQASEEAT